MLNSTAAPVKRSLALDALRGFAILTMILSGVVPWNSLPAWMYHAQTPPPTRAFNPGIPGITWVDLVFPFFLFSMGAAIPIAMSSRIKKGAKLPELMFYIFERGFLLVAFAIFRQHVVGIIYFEKKTTFMLFESAFAFVILFMIYMRFPDNWDKKLKIALRTAGWILAIGLMAIVRQDNGERFSIGRSDIIIMVLANMAVFGSLIWLVTRESILIRLGVMAFYLAMNLSANAPENSWIKLVFNFPSKNYGIYAMGFLKYLYIIIPGTIVGDLTLKWLASGKNEGGKSQSWDIHRYSVISVLMFMFILITLIGLYTRFVWQTTFLSAFMCLLGYHLMKNPLNENEKFLKRIYLWGVYWFLLGLLFEPYEGGIKKDHSTMSYYFVTSGLAIFMLIGFTIIIDILNKKKYLNLLITNGQNPMIAYVGYSNFIAPVLMITGVFTLLDKVFVSPWMGFIYACLKTLLLALMVNFCTKKKIFWRT